MGILTLRWTFPFELLLIFFPVCPSAALNCETDCTDYTNPNFKPQECAQQCSGTGTSDEEMSDSLEGVLEEVSSLRVMVIILLFLVTLLVLLLALLLLRGAKWKRWITKVNRKVKVTNAEGEKGKQASSGPNKEGVTIANYTCSYSPSPRHEGPQRTSSVKEDPLPSAEVLALDATKQRARLPSESACPSESQIEVNGYDNLALSTSTINFHSRPSSPSSPADTASSADTTAVSMATLDTTMTTVQLDFGSACSPSASEVGRQSGRT